MKKKFLLSLLLVVLAGALIALLKYRHLADLIVGGESRELRDRNGEKTAGSGPAIFVIAIDGAGRDLIYGLLKQGKLPGLSSLLGGDARKSSGSSRFPHAYFADNITSTFPSSTLPAWASLFTGAPPGESGVTGNEFFIRDRMHFAAPAPVSFQSIEPIVEVYQDSYMDDLLEVPTIYERMREAEPDILIWVALSHFYKGADRLILAARAVLSDAATHFLDVLGKEQSVHPYSDLDSEVLEELSETIKEQGRMPDVLTLYLSGLDLYTHKSRKTPDEARVDYLTEVLDPYFQKIVSVGTKAGYMEDIWVVLVSDHGHTDVVPDNHLHREKQDLRAVLREAGFRVRDFEWKDTRTDYQAVIAYGGATAFVYLADRSKCAGLEDRCLWSAPARKKQDVLIAAEAIYQASTGAESTSHLKNSLDMILIREPEQLSGFSVYTGGGITVPLDEALSKRKEEYVLFEKRLQDLSSAPHGERAGDILLLTLFGEGPASNRFYFATEYESWHGSASRQDSEVSFVLANPSWRAADIENEARAFLGAAPRIHQVGNLLIALRHWKTAKE